MCLIKQISLVAMICVINLGVCDGNRANDLPVNPKVQPVVQLAAQPFALEDVRLLNGPFKHAMEQNGKYLLFLEVDRLLHNFRVNAGLPSTAQPLGGWERPNVELRGHFVGHYMSACAKMYAGTGNELYKLKADAVVAGLAECQAKLGTGYLSAFPESFIDRVETGQRVWAPYYTLHKILAGLLDVYVYCGNTQALAVACKFGDWVAARTSRLTDEQMQAMLDTEYGGMNEALANLYALTGDRKYLAVACRFNHQKVIGPAQHGQDNLTGLHANTQIPKFIGVARQYELTGTESLRAAAEFFWRTVVRNRSYVIGGHSDGEIFVDTNRLSRMGWNTAETCNTYNMLKLTRHLFCWAPRVEYADYYERALYNHILASQDPETGMTCYYVPLRAGGRKRFCEPYNSFWCCTGTGVENHSRYGESIYFHSDNALYIALFIASELNWRQNGVVIRQETRYPDEPATKLILSCAAPVRFALNIRYPAWARKGVTVTLNGRKQPIKIDPGNWIVLERTWRSGDVVRVTMPFPLYTDAFADNTNRFAFLSGPVVLAGAVADPPYPAVVGTRQKVVENLRPVPEKPNCFIGSAAIFRRPTGEGIQVVLEPFYKIYDRPYQVYWDSFTPAEWADQCRAYQTEQTRLMEIQSRTVDAVVPGDQASERAHNYRGQRSHTGRFGERMYRDAAEGGWFAWDLKVLPDQPQELVIIHWGSDSGRRFDVLVDEEKIASTELAGEKPGEFYDRVFRLPAVLVCGKTNVTVKIQASPDTWAGAVYGVRIQKIRARE